MSRLNLNSASILMVSSLGTIYCYPFLHQIRSISKTPLLICRHAEVTLNIDKLDEQNEVGTEQDGVNGGSNPTYTNILKEPIEEVTQAPKVGHQVI